MTTLDPPFEYDPLREPREIRVLRLYPGSQDDPLSCNLEHVDLDDDPEYEAISYVWGDPTFSHRIICGTGHVAVTKSLYVVLRRLRQQDHIRTVWIDGVCINQKDTKERGHQVMLMGDVFRRAQRVVIWLGEDDQNCATDAFEACTRICTAGVKSTDSVDELTKKFDQQVYALRNLAECSWFQRTWVLQELVLARSATVLWGDCEISWDEIHVASHILTSYWPVRYIEAGMNLTKIETFIEIKSVFDISRIGLLSALRWTHGLHSVDPRDKIYGLLGLLSESKARATSQIAKLITPDYSRDAGLVYEDLALSVARFGMAGELIRSVRHGSTLPKWTPESAPSWAPDWGRIPRRGRSYTSFENLFSRLGYMDLLPARPRTKFLSGRSIKIANIHNVSEEADHRAPIACFNTLVEFWHEYTTRPNHTASVGDENIISRFAESFTEGSDSFSGGFNPRTSISMLYAASHCIFEDSFASYDHKSSKYMAARAFLDCLEKYCGEPSTSFQHMYRDRFTPWLSFPEEQRLFITDTDLVGLGPAAMRSGDEVRCLPGTCMPMVLRPQDDFYQLVGGCYIAGLMDLDSEDLKKVCRDFNVEDIEIR